MTKNEMIEKVKLTPEQAKAFKRMRKALSDFESAGGELIGNDSFQYGVNGRHIDEVKDGYLGDMDDSCSVYLDECNAPSLQISDPFIDTSPFMVIQK